MSYNGIPVSINNHSLLNNTYDEYQHQEPEPQPPQVEKTISRKAFDGDNDFRKQQIQQQLNYKNSQVQLPISQQVPQIQQAQTQQPAQ